MLGIKDKRMSERRNKDRKRKLGFMHSIQKILRTSNGDAGEGYTYVKTDGECGISISGARNGSSHRTKKSVQTVMRQHVFCSMAKKKPRTAEPKGPAKRLALTKETIAGEWLLEIIPPRRKIWVCVRNGVPWGSISIVSQQCLPRGVSTTTLTR